VSDDPVNCTKAEHEPGEANCTRAGESELYYRAAVTPGLEFSVLRPNASLANVSCARS